MAKYKGKTIGTRKDIEGELSELQDKTFIGGVEVVACTVKAVKTGKSQSTAPQSKPTRNRKRVFKKGK